MVKPKVTRTYGPIHFEDLDPHRFEDLIRELIYDYKEWQSIEATGRSGSDDGFDIRAYEKVGITSQVESDDDEVEEVHLMEGNLWMIQGKREKSIGPQKVKSIIADIDAENPPYGYILAASANFSKKSYDIFREELRKKGVMEFYLWGKPELEDMLHFPKNDRILFTFFGISLVSKRKSRTTKVRSAINIKNKQYKVVGEGHKFYESVLIRDLKDTYYPYESKYKDFKKRPRWKEYVAFGHHQLGLLCHSRECFAYVDTVKKEWDYTEEVDLVNRQGKYHDDHQIKAEKRELVQGVWDFFPRKNQGYLVIDCLVKYADIALVDEKGDVGYECPHIYVDFMGDKGPFAGGRRFLKLGDREIDLTDEYKRINKFPEKFIKLKLGTIHKEQKITFASSVLEQFKKHFRIDTLYDSDGKYSFLEPRDVISVSNDARETEEDFIQITHKFKSKIKHVYDTHVIRRDIEQQLGKQFDDNEEINVYEFKRIYKWQYEKSDE